MSGFIWTATIVYNSPTGRSIRSSWDPQEIDGAKNAFRRRGFDKTHPKTPLALIFAVPDAAVPDAAVPDAAVPDAAVPDAAVPVATGRSVPTYSTNWGRNRREKAGQLLSRAAPFPDRSPHNGNQSDCVRPDCSLSACPPE
jgi:hypothetical protein